MREKSWLSCGMIESDSQRRSSRRFHSRKSYQSTHLTEVLEVSTEVVLQGRSTTSYAPAESTITNFNDHKRFEGYLRVSEWTCDVQRVS